MQAQPPREREGSAYLVPNGCRRAGCSPKRQALGARRAFAPPAVHPPSDLLSNPGPACDPGVMRLGQTSPAHPRDCRAQPARRLEPPAQPAWQLQPPAVLREPHRPASRCNSGHERNGRQHAPQLALRDWMRNSPPCQVHLARQQTGPCGSDVPQGACSLPVSTMVAERAGSPVYSILQIPF